MKSRGRRLIPSMVMLALLVFALAGCGGGESEEERATRQMQQRIDELRSLPYVGGSSGTAGAARGVISLDGKRMCPGYRLYTIRPLGRADLITETGDLVHSWEIPGDRWGRAELLPNGDLLVVGATDHGWREGRPAPFATADSARYLLRMDWSGETVWKRSMQTHHDVEVTPDGHLLVLTFKRSIEPRIHASIPARDDLLTLLDADGGLVEERSLLAAARKSPRIWPLGRVRSSKLGAEPWIDLFHANSIEWMRHEPLFDRHEIYGPEKVLVCSRHQDRIGILDWTTGAWIWSWGSGETSGPHDAQLLPDGHILLFDNGLGRGWSRALEIDPLTGEIVWSYGGDPPRSFYTASRGSAQRLPNGNTLLAESDKGRAIEVTAEGAIVWEYVCPWSAGKHEVAAIVRMTWYAASVIDALIAAD